MNSFIEFHCDINSNFHAEYQQVRGFTYTDYVIAPHTHEFYEINIVLKGHGVHIIENNSIDVAIGNVFVIPPNIVHAYANTEKLDVYHILAKPEFINKLFESNSIKGLNSFLQIEPMLRKNVAKNLFLRLTSKQLAHIKYDLEALSEGNSNMYPTYNEFKNYTVLKLLSWFSYLIVEQNSNKDKAMDSYTENIILNLIDYIYKNYSKIITIDELCKIANMSRATLFRKFKAYCNCSPMEFIINYRTKMALSLLEKKKQSKTVIAQECGFYDLSHMEKALKHV